MHLSKVPLLVLQDVLCQLVEIISVIMYKMIELNDVHLLLGLSNSLICVDCVTVLLQTHNLFWPLHATVLVSMRRTRHHRKHYVINNAHMDSRV